jgi:dipeptidyl aminopeptidase/acylaminoacyl peptidase
MSQPGYESDRKVLTVYNRETGEHQALTSTLDRSVGDMVWTRDADALFFTARDQGRSNIFRVDLGGKVTRVVEGGYSERIGITPDGKRLVFVRSFNHQPAEIFSHSLASGETIQLTSFNAGIAREIDLPELEDFWFSGAEGTRVHGFIQKPPGFDPARKYPVVLVIHGGPQGMWGDRFMTTWFTFALASSPGYVAVMINPRGSSGYGLEFRTQVSRDYGGRCMQDLQLGLDHAIATYPYVDAERQAAIGGSFGGYSVNWLIGHTDRFKCTVSHAGIYNLTSFYGATEELWYPAWDTGKSPWQEPELYARWSPHLAAASFSSPTLVTHGELDYRVPFAESLQLFTALQVQGIPSRLVVFPDDGHVISKPQNNVRWWKEIHRWLGEHL